MRIIFVTREGYDLAGGRIRSYNFAKELSKYGPHFIIECGA